VAIEVERRASAVWRAALGATEGPHRELALQAFTASAVRATRWRRTAGVTPVTEPFPGQPA